MSHFCCAQVLNGDFTCPSGGSQRFTALIRSMLAVSPASRPDIGTVLRQLQQPPPSRSPRQPAPASKPAEKAHGAKATAVQGSEPPAAYCEALASFLVLRCHTSMYLCPPALQTGMSHAGVSTQLSATPSQRTAPPNGAWETGGWALDAWEAPSASAPSPAVKSVSQVFWLTSNFLLYDHLYRHDVPPHTFRSDLFLQAEAKPRSADGLPKRETASSEGSEASAPRCSQPCKTLLQHTSSLLFHHHAICMNAPTKSGLTRLCCMWQGCGMAPFQQGQHLHCAGPCFPSLM